MSTKLASVKTSIRHNTLNQPANGVFRNCFVRSYKTNDRLLFISSKRFSTSNSCVQLTIQSLGSLKYAWK